MMLSKICTKCKEEKGLESFRKIANSPRLTAHCIECDNRRRRKHYRENPEQWKRTAYLNRYNISYEEYLQMVEDRNGKCDICEKESSRALAVDHNHSCCSGDRSCGKCIRGLLCDRCNGGLGCFDDDLEKLKLAIIYLEKGLK